MRHDGSDLEPLTDGDNLTAGVPAVSAAGDSIAFRGGTSFQPTEWHLYVMGAEGTEPRRLTQGLNVGRVSWR